MDKTTWQDILMKIFPKFSGKNSANVVVIGGGITGISTAYFLAQKGASVIVVEKGKLDESMTACTTAFLTSSIDTNLPDLKKVYGKNDLKLIINSHEEAINEIEKIIKREKIECDFSRVSNYKVALKKASHADLALEKNILEEVGVHASFMPPASLPFPNFGSLEVPNQAKFHPLKYLVGLREASETLGVKFFERSGALSIEGDKTVIVSMENGNIEAKNVVIATYNPFQEPKGFIWKKGMYVSYVLELEVEKGVLPPLMMEDDSNPYHYVRVDSKSETKDRLIVGGQDHRKEIHFNPNRGYNALMNFVEKKLLITNYKIITKWTGDILESSDGLPFIGLQDEKYDNRFVATAFSGNGMTYGTIAAMLISDLITHKKNIWQDIYDPRRLIMIQGLIFKALDYTAEFINGVSDNLFHSTELGKK